MGRAEDWSFLSTRRKTTLTSVDTENRDRLRRQKCSIVERDTGLQMLDLGKGQVRHKDFILILESLDMSALLYI